MFFFFIPLLPRLCLCFITRVLGWHFTVFFFSPPLSNFPTDCLPVPSSVRLSPSPHSYMRRYAWITSILSPWPQYSLSTARISTDSVCVCVCPVYVECVFPLAPAVLPLPLSLLIMSADQFITCTDLYRHRLLVWRHWTERGSIVVRQWLDIHCILKKKTEIKLSRCLDWSASSLQPIADVLNVHCFRFTVRGL